MTVNSRVPSKTWSGLRFVKVALFLQLFQYTVRIQKVTATQYVLEPELSLDNSAGGKDSQLLSAIHRPSAAAADAGQDTRPIEDSNKRLPLTWDPARGHGSASFSGIQTFAHSPYVDCFGRQDQEAFDIAVLGMPFDSLASFRPGARFGPSGLRRGSQRMSRYGQMNPTLGLNPLNDWAKVVDCGDVPATPFDPMSATLAMESAYKNLLHRQMNHSTKLLTLNSNISADSPYVRYPRIATLGGDHSTVYPILRGIGSAYGPVAIVHFDAHLDTWSNESFKDPTSHSNGLTHGTYLHMAYVEGHIQPNASIHIGLRGPMFGTDYSDWEQDSALGFERLFADDVDRHGIDYIIHRVRQRVKDLPVYISLDIDVLDPAFAMGTGTPEHAGLSTRELKQVLQGMAGLNIVGVDLVETSPPFDSAGENTVTVGAMLVLEMIALMVKWPYLVQ